MNNACPSCGAVYAVSSKDIGRKLKCKKCSSSLIVSDDGLVLDGAATATAQPAARPAAIEVEDEDAGQDDVVIVKKKGKSRPGRGGAGLGEFLSKVGGIPTILFAFGVFLVLWFTFMPRIGDAAVARAEAMAQKIDADGEAKLKDKLPKGKTEATLNEDERKKYLEAKQKIAEDLVPQLLEADHDAKMARINNARSVWYDRYGLMFGFIFVAFGCIGYLRSDQTLVLRIVAGVVLSFMLMVVFVAFGGCGEHSTPPLPRTKAGAGFP